MAAPGTKITPGSGWSGATSNPGKQGSSGGLGYDHKAGARWDVVPYQEVTGSFGVGVVAAHASGIARVEFAVEGGSWVSIDSMGVNPRTDEDEYWVEIDAADFADGFAEVRAIVYPVHGDPFVMQDDSPWTGNHDHLLVLGMNAGGGIDSEYPEVVLGAGVHNLSTSPRPNTGWLTYRADDGVAAEDCVIESMGDFSSGGRVRFKGLTLHQTNPAANDLFHGSNSDSLKDWIWFDEARCIGDFNENDTPDFITKIWSRIFFTGGFYSGFQQFCHGQVGVPLVRGTTIGKLREDHFRVAGLVLSVDSLTHERDPGDHPDVFEISGSFDYHDFIVRGLYVLTTFTQGLAGSGCFNSLFERVYIHTESVQGGSAQGVQINGAWENVVLKNFGTNRGFRLQTDDAFAADAFVMDNVSAGSFTPSDPSTVPGVTVTSHTLSDGGSPPGWSSQPTNVTTGDGSDADFGGTATGSPAPDVFLQSGDDDAFASSPSDDPDWQQEDEGHIWTGVEAADDGRAVRLVARNLWGIAPSDTVALTVSGGAGTAPTITNAAPNGTADQAYSHQYTADGDTPLTWGLTAGSLPPGLSLTSGGLLSGTPTQDGSYNFTIEASNSTGTDTLAETVEIAAESTASILDSLSPQPDLAWRCGSVSPEIGTGDLVLNTGASFDSGDDAFTGDPDGSIHAPESSTGRFTAPGIDALVNTPGWAICVFFKLPTSIADFGMMWRMVDGSNIFELIFNDQGHILPHFSNGSEDAWIDWPLTPTTGDWHRLFVWHDEVNDLVHAKVDGAAANAAAFTGTGWSFAKETTFGADEDGTNKLDVKIGEIYVWGSNPGDIDSQLADLVTATPDAPPTITNTAPDGEVGSAYSHQYTANGETPITWSTINGTLPAGLSMDSAGLISGTPTADGSYQFTVQASNTHGNETLIETVEIVVDPAAVPSITNAAPDGAVGSAYSHQYTADGDTPITWSIINGIVPPGLALDSDGLLSGTPTDGGVYEFTVRASNLSGEDDLVESAAIAVAPSFDTHPANRSVTPGGTAQFDVSVSGVPAPALQWQVDDGGGWADITDETGASLILVDVSLSQDGHQYRCVATNSEGSANSDAATLTVNEATNRRGIRDLSRSIFNFPRMYGPIALYRR